MIQRILILLLLFLVCLAFLNWKVEFQPFAIGNGVSIGSALAVAICWSRTESVLTSILAGIFGWVYVIYYLMIRERSAD